MAARKKVKQKKAVKRKTVKRTVKKKTAKKTTVKRKVTRKRSVKKTAPVRTVTPHYVHREDKPTAGLGVVVLLLNALVLPGLGSLIGKRINSGLIQLILAILGQLFLGSLVHSQLAVGLTGLGALQIIGLVLVLLSWIWGILTGILVIKDSF